MKLKCRFGIPQHGWLPIFITCDDFQNEMKVSDMPVNSVDMLIQALSRILDGVDSKVWWHLKPANYTLDFVPQEVGGYNYSI